MSVPGKMHSFFVPGISLIGVGACHGIPHYVHTYHITKPLIVTDKGIVNTGILKIITDILDGDNIPYSIYDKTVPNPTDENVTEGVAQYKACLLYTSVEDADTGEEREFTLLGPDEADYAKGTISIQSPVGVALLGKEVGDEITVNAPRGRINYEIIDIQFKKKTA